MRKEMVAMVAVLCVAVLVPRPAGALVLHVTTIDAGAVETLDWTGDTGDADNTGITLWNRSDAPATVSIEYLPVNPPGDPPEGFLLLDGTLRVDTGALGDGDLRMLVVREYDPVRARRKRLKRERMSVMRRDRARAKYRRARCLVRPMLTRKKRLVAEIRLALRRKEAGLLGSRGIDLTNTCVWAVVDKSSDFVAGGEVIPEPVSLACVVGGLGVLVLGRRRRT